MKTELICKESHCGSKKNAKKDRIFGVKFSQRTGKKQLKNPVTTQNNARSKKNLQIHQTSLPRATIPLAGHLSKTWMYQTFVRRLRYALIDAAHLPILQAAGQTVRRTACGAAFLFFLTTPNPHTAIKATEKATPTRILCSVQPPKKY